MTFQLINETHQQVLYAAMTATSLAAAALLAPIEAIRIIGMTVLTGVGYGIANDMIGCRDCIEYFTLGHFYDELNLENRPLNTLNPTLNAFAWGMIASWRVSLIAGAALALIARLSFFGLPLKITAVQLAPYLFIGAALIIILAHVLSRWAASKMAEEPHLKYPGVPLDLQAGWEACVVRNTTGYAALGIGSTILSIAIIAARMGLIPL